MPTVVKDRVKVTSTTTGTGTFTLGSAVDGFQDFSAISPTSAAWDISAASYSNNKFSVATQETNPEDVFFKPDGTKMYVIGRSGDDVNEYDLSVPWNVSSASYLQNFSVAAKDTFPTGMFFKSDGTKMYISGAGSGSVHEYDLSSAWNISTASFLQSFSVSAKEANPNALFFKPDGTKMYVGGPGSDDVNEYDLGTPWDISTATFLQAFDVSSFQTFLDGLFFKPDGTKMYTVGSTEREINEFDLSSAWDISTASHVQFVTFNSLLGNFNIDARGVFFRSDGTKFYTVSETSIPASGITDSVYEFNLGANETYYTITDGTDWEVGAGICLAGTVLERVDVFESSNSNAAVNWGAGDKEVFVTFPAENTQGTVPTGDNSSVGTDLVAWTNLKKTLDAGVVNGVPYANNGVNGIVSTYSLIYTTTVAYFGGVLAPNEDIHFVPFRATVGQKISKNGLVSTYSLVYTTTNAYAGAVLSPNGDINFVPRRATVGQKISASGVVSTYSLVYTITDAYTGGVLAPNGDIHFAPVSAAVGQKISAAGVVSTYSLVYTASGAYSGGVLAPNGDIHFVPQDAAVGQKISAAGVVSTYSLTYTTSLAYEGGVLSPNGDIHFIPFRAAVGQKISADGTVSTYSLVYTLLNAYYGGVLAPNGDIHFVPSVAGVGQKISVSGVVSTYSLVYTISGAYNGGVLAPNGDIYFIPYSAAVGQKISTGVQVEPGFALSPFFNKF